MKWIKRNNFNSISELVKHQTHMSEEELLCDRRQFVYPGLNEAVTLLLDHIKAGTAIRVYGDYDVDGVTSLYILKTMFESVNYKNVSFVAPRRFSDGYGINVHRVKDFYDEVSGKKLLITVDNGIAAIQAIKLAKDLGMDVLILDHHEPFVENGQVVLPNADVIVDPHVTGGYVLDDPSHEFKDLCGAGLSYRFACEVLKRYKPLTDSQREETLSKLICAAALGTVADLVSLTDDNRIIVKEGIKAIASGEAPIGLRALIRALNLTTINASSIAFSIAPCINASGRLYDDGADQMVALLSYPGEITDEELTKMAEDAKKTNDERKTLTREAVARAEDYMSKRLSDNVIVILDEMLSSGIAGLVASALVEEFFRPAIVLSKGPVLLKGSGRSIEGVNLKGLLDESSAYLEGYGGHPMAAGVSLKPENLDSFRKAICSIAPEPKEHDIYYDIECKPSVSALQELLSEYNKYEPYGSGNPAPVIMIPGILLGDKLGNTSRIIGSEKTHVKLITSLGFDIVWFDGAAAYKLLGEPKKVDIIGTIGLNTFNGKTTIQVQVKHLRRSV